MHPAACGACVGWTRPACPRRVSRKRARAEGNDASYLGASSTHFAVGCRWGTDRGAGSAIRVPAAPIVGVGCQRGTDRGAAPAIRVPAAPIVGVGCQRGTDRTGMQAIRVPVAPVVGVRCRRVPDRPGMPPIWMPVAPIPALGADGVSTHCEALRCCRTRRRACGTPSSAHSLGPAHSLGSARSSTAEIGIPLRHAGHTCCADHTQGIRKSRKASYQRLD